MRDLDRADGVVVPAAAAGCDARGRVHDARGAAQHGVAGRADRARGYTTRERLRPAFDEDRALMDRGRRAALARGLHAKRDLARAPSRHAARSAVARAAVALRVADGLLDRHGRRAVVSSRCDRTALSVRAYFTSSA